MPFKRGLFQELIGVTPLGPVLYQKSTLGRIERPTEEPFQVHLEMRRAFAGIKRIVGAWTRCFYESECSTSSLQLCGPRYGLRARCWLDTGIHGLDDLSGDVLPVSDDTNAR